MTKKKKNNPKTVVALILDKSTSMGSTREQTVNGYNLEVQAAKKAAQEGQDIKVCLVTFASDVFEHLWLEDAEKLEEASYESYVPNGNTAMYDAMGYTIKKLQQTVDDDEDTCYLVKVISDGDDNDSHHYTAPQVNEHVTELESNGRWTVAFMGCNENCLKRVARDTGIKLGNMAAWNNMTADRAAKGMHANIRRTEGYYKARSRGVLRSDNFYSDQIGTAAAFDEALVGSSGVMQLAPVNPNEVQTSMLCAKGSANVFGQGGRVDWSANQ